MAQKDLKPRKICEYYIGLNKLAFLLWQKGYSMRFVCVYIHISASDFKKVFRSPYDWLRLPQYVAIGELLDLPLQQVIYYALPARLRAYKEKHKSVSLASIHLKGMKGNANWFEGLDD